MKLELVILWLLLIGNIADGVQYSTVFDVPRVVKNKVPIHMYDTYKDNSDPSPVNAQDDVFYTPKSYFKKITPSWYYQKNTESTRHVTPLFELAGSVDMDSGVDCSIRGAFMEWAAEYNGHHAMLCLKKIKEHSDGGWETHVYLKLDYPYKPIKGKHSHSYCYYDTLDGYTLVLDSEPDWQWFDSPTLTAETLDEFVVGIQEDLGLDMDYEYEFYWWERPEMIRSMNQVKAYQHENRQR